jgi:hypothetical protein
MGGEGGGEEMLLFEKMEQLDLIIHPICRKLNTLSLSLSLSLSISLSLDPSHDYLYL